MVNRSEVDEAQRALDAVLVYLMDRPEACVHVSDIREFLDSLCERKEPDTEPLKTRVDRIREKISNHEEKIGRHRKTQDL